MKIIERSYNKAGYLKKKKVHIITEQVIRETVKHSLQQPSNFSSQTAEQLLLRASATPVS